MPWKDKTVKEIRAEFVEQVYKREKSKSVLCKEYGISRPTGDKWLKRYESGEGLADKSRRPFHTANRISQEMEETIVAARRKEPAIGATKTKRMLENQGIQMPAMSTINAVFQRNGLITKEASQAATPYRKFEKEAPNEMWQGDFKGNFMLQNGQRCHPLSLLDDHSRYCLNADAKSNEQITSTKMSFIRAFEAYGLPFSLLCDNGNPWGCSQSTSITKFEVWLMELGVLVLHIRPRHPQTQGKVERFNGSYKRERLNFYTPRNLADAQSCREEYLDFYNNQRPHAALNYDVPASRYRPSSRVYNAEVTPWDYQFGCEIRQIKSSGYLTFRGQGYYLSEGLGDKQVAILPSDTDGVFDIVFRQFRVAKLNLHSRTISSRKIYLLHDDPRQFL